jgi:hypothetical protein
MNEDLATWLPGVLALIFGGGIGLIMSSKIKATPGKQNELETTLADLEERANHYIALLRDLKEQEARLAPQNYATQKQGLEQLAAEALRHRDGKLKAAAQPQKTKASAGRPGESQKVVEKKEIDGFFAKRPQLKGFMWGVGTLAVGVFLYTLVQEVARPREESGSVTGNSSMMKASSQSSSPSLQAARRQAEAYLARLKDDPNDVDAMLGLGHLLIEAGATHEARAVLSQVKKIAPDHQGIDDLAKALGALSAENKPAVVASQNDAARGAVAGISWATPPAWSKQARRPMRVATYLIPSAQDDEEDAECAVYYFGKGQGGSVEANITRWLGQMQDPEGRDIASLMQREDKLWAGLKTTQIDVQGTFLFSPRPMASEKIPKPGYRMVASIVQAPEGPVFFKLIGPDKTVNRAKAALSELLESLQVN